MLNIIKRFDKFSSPIFFSISRREKLSSIFGGFMTLAIYVLYFIIIVYFSNQFLSYREFTITSGQKYS